MFNAPRPAQRYASGTGPGNFGGSFVDTNPLAASTYDGLDPWSAAPSPSPPPGPAPTSVFGAVIADATVPSIYSKALVAVDPGNSGETSVSSLSRVLGTSGLGASTIDKIVSLVSSKPRVSKLEFFVALALVGLAQSGGDISIEQVAALAAQNALPEPSLDLSALPPSSSTIEFRSSPPAVPPTFAPDDPWSAPSRIPGRAGAHPGINGIENGVSGGPSTVSGTGMPPNWWRRQDTASVNLLGQQGFLLRRYMVYEVTTEKGPPVPRRYSEFVYLWDCLVRRYPFRLLPALPPKRLGPDESFIEQRRRGLARFLNFVMNHPIIKDDGILAVFLTEASLETWRKHASVSLEEEAYSKRLDRVEEMSIPSDLEEKLAVVRGKLNAQIENWQKICILAERMIKRREGAASDVARMTNTLKALVEVNAPCWRGDVCELCSGVNSGISHVASHCQRHADFLEGRSRNLLYSTLESLKSERDLYIAMRDLFIRRDKQSGDQVEKLKKRVETSSSKLNDVKETQKDGWQDEAEKLSIAIEKDKAAIQLQLHRRVFIRACIWHELRVVLHNRENTLLTQAVQLFTKEESEFSNEVAANWSNLREAVQDMPYE
ncbi:hypothetical protein PUNSTDRAFT_54291 [Punctularia strigosozonata HHB-11173 SS5]|uniref:uncharacterized protein n=1 Tax=Punctularia strigosozonata (strain HHB-11173) TaxID=741275 RepID=UPI000441636A|nr:uncharacterized protein PUNSTDRAFT_54291 [Punctularia strigosozonata HHB-11173 SS5]EIN05981.1 hypothetical protein PUNSTDRAFT_54291 [Punctularia strigosozonata HHB-11173 SS5]